MLRPAERTKSQRVSLGSSSLNPTSADTGKLMDAHRVSPHHNQMDYNHLAGMEAKQGKMLPCQEERFDSGLDSLKEELANDFEEMSMSDGEVLPQEYEAWRAAVTDDGDT